MSFRCDSCFSAVPSGVSPIKVVETRPTSYLNIVEDENGDPLEKTTIGTEIVRELNLCATCAGVEMKAAPAPANTQIYHEYAHDAFFHLQKSGRDKRGCKKELEDCKICKKIVEAFAQFPKGILSVVLEDKKAPTYKVRTAAVVLENVLNHGEAMKGRTYRSNIAALALLKGYQERGGGL